MDGKPPVGPSLPRGADLLHNARLNKWTAFTEAERDALGLTGLLPEGVDDEETQARAASTSSSAASPRPWKSTSISTRSRTTTRRYSTRALMSDPVQFMPLVYTPTVGEACQQFGQMLRRPKGLYVSIKRRGRVRELLRNWPERDVPHHRRDRRRTHPRPGRPRRQRHGHPHRQAGPLHRLRRRAAARHAAADARRGHRTTRVCSATHSTSACASRASAAPRTTPSSTSS